MRTLPVALAVLLLFAPVPGVAAVVIDFEDATAGEVLDGKYAAQGLALTGIGDGGPFPIIADIPCGAPASGQFVLSLRPLEECPEMNDSHGWIEVSFDEPQPRVSIRGIARGPAAVIYFKAYDEQGFLDQKIGQVGDAWDGVPQTLEITRDPEERQITRVEFGALRSGQTAGFDDLGFEVVPVATQRTSWSAVKARF